MTGYLSDEEHLATLLLPRDARELATVTANANTIRVVVHGAPGDAPTQRVDPDARCRLVVAVARRVEAEGGGITAGPGLHPNVYSAIGHWGDRDVIVTARLDDDESDYLAARLADGME